MQRKPARELTPDEVLAKVEHFCAYRERAPKEVAAKIRELGLRGEAGEQIFDLLRDEGFFDEERFALAYAGGKFRINHWGKTRIRLELGQLGISPPVVARALDSIPEMEYLAVIQKLMERKKAQLAHEDTFTARQKLVAYLIRAGFEPEVVFAAL